MVFNGFIKKIVECLTENRAVRRTADHPQRRTGTQCGLGSMLWIGNSRPSGRGLGRIAEILVQRG